MNELPLVSIVILTYNNSNVLRRCIKSALALDYPEREIIVVDNASSDDTAEVVRREFGDRVRLISREENSPVAARNEGFWAARGEIIVSLDHDMIIPAPDFLRRSVQLFRTFPDVGLLSARICGEESPHQPLSEHWWYATPITEHESYFYTSYFSEGTAVFRTRALRDSGGYEESFVYAAENLDLSLKLLDRGWRILYCPTLSSTELIVSGHLSRRRSLGNYYSLRNRLWIAWIHLPLFRALGYALPRVAAAAVRSSRFGWFDYFLSGLRDGIFAPAEIRAKRRPLTAARWAEIHRMEGAQVDPSLAETDSEALAV